MLEIIQTGQAGKTNLLFDMHRMRKRVFNDRMGWNVQITAGGLEVDQFDGEDTVYLLVLNDDRQVIGSWRLLPTTGATMVREVWPQFLETLPIPSCPEAWEASRFAVDCPAINPEDGLAQLNRATQELFVGLTELCLLCGIKDIFTLYDMRIARLLRRLDCPPTAVGERLMIDDTPAEVGRFTTDATMLTRLREATGITESLVTIEMLPPVLQHYRARLKQLPRSKADGRVPANWGDITLVPTVRSTPRYAVS